jgi:hypothetical protein
VQPAGRPRQKSRLLPAGTEPLSEKAPQATFSHRLGDREKFPQRLTIAGLEIDVVMGCVLKDLYVP